MTNKEAIELLNEIRTMFARNDKKTALDMAMEALETVEVQRGLINALINGQETLQKHFLKEREKSIEAFQEYVENVVYQLDKISFPVPDDYGDHVWVVDLYKATELVEGGVEE